ncbi:UPF0158 family protein [Pendulispora albinea]|uniref:UPF0158 family protein n=1 Tax=Pendulispora albinea TaxID=2741071 RepID=A0ABZ2LNF1_9BACT
MNEPADRPAATTRDVPVDWEALEDAFENNAPEVHSYLHLSTGEVLRVVDGVADPQMHVRISSDPNYLRIDPVSSREQYRWMERFIPMVEDNDLRAKLGHAIDGKGAFRRFKDVLMSFGADREKWFTFRSERLRTFMEAWLTAHAIRPTARPQWAENSSAGPESEGPLSEVGPSSEEAPKSTSGRRARNAEASRQHLREVAEGLGPRDLETIVAFAEFLKARRAARGFAHHHEHLQERERQAPKIDPGPASQRSPEEKEAR